MKNILETVKKLIGIPKEDTSFDVDIIIYINSTLVILSQLGLSEADKLPVVDEFTDWTNLLADRTDLEIVKSYISMKTKLMFDPPTSSVAMEALNRTIAEMEWRIANHQVKEVINNESTSFRKRT